MTYSFTHQLIFHQISFKQQQKWLNDQQIIDGQIEFAVKIIKQQDE